MTRQDDDGEILSKNILDWLTRVGAIATALAAILAVCLPKDLGNDAKRLAYAIAILLALGSGAVFYYQRRRAARFKMLKAPETLAPSAARASLA